VFASEQKKPRISLINTDNPRPLHLIREDPRNP
jgi:hypothetical protein